MEEYGYINEDGYLVSKILEPHEIMYKDEDGNLKSKTVTIAEQLAEMGDKWKPVELVDDEKMDSGDPYYTIQIIPYDAGDRISYKYEKVPGNAYLKTVIDGLKKQLRDDDYKVIKCYEFSLVGEEMPYDIVSLNSKRQAIRDQINELEAKQVKLNSL